MSTSALSLATRLDGVSESATLKLNAAVNAMKSQGVEVFNLAAGEPDFNVDDRVKEAVVEALKQNKSKYTPAAGNVDLRTAIAEKTNKQQPSVSTHTPWKAADVVVTNGGKQALFNAFLATLDPGDEVIIPSPYWLSYPEMVKIAGGVPKIVQTTLESGFRITPEQLRNAITPKTRMLIVNSPSNPTGAMYSKSELAALGEVLSWPSSSRVLVLSDEIYDRIILGDTPFTSFLEAAPQLRERVITVNCLSKSAAMTGWRVGWSVAPTWVTAGMATLQGQSTSGINSLAQAASVAALKLPREYFDANEKTFRRRCDLVLEILSKSSKLDVFRPGGAFYVFVGVGRSLKPGEDSMGFAERLLEGAKVAVVPGTPFGGKEFLRLSFATDENTIRKGCERLVEFAN